MPMHITLYYFTVILITRALAILPLVMPLFNVKMKLGIAVGSVCLTFR